MGKKHIVLVTGGQRSGKSGYAQKLALSLTANPVYLATSRVWDEEFRERVLRHQADRGPEWTNIEEEKYLSRHDLNGRVVVIDCVTLWVTNFFFDNEGDTNRSLGELKEEFNKFTEQDAYLIFVTNEIGLGGVSPDVVQRRFTDLQGWLNQYIASRADEVVLMVSGHEICAIRILHKAKKIWYNRTYHKLCISYSFGIYCKILNWYFFTNCKTERRSTR